MPEDADFAQRIKNLEEKLLLIVNPMSKKGLEVANRVKSLIRREGIDLEEATTDLPDDDGATIDFWSKRFGGSRITIVFGGDGAVNQVVNNLMITHSNKNAVLVPIPAGTANDFCRAIGMDSVEASLESMAHLETRPIDLIKIEIDGKSPRVRYVSNSISFGLDGGIARRSQKYKKFGVPGYWYAALTWALLLLFKGMDYYRMRVKIDDFEYEGQLLDAVFTNIETYGQNFKWAPGASVDDGFIHVILVKPMGTVRAVFNSLLILKGLHTRLSRFIIMKCNEAEVELLDDVYTQEDGEVFFYPSGTKIKLSIEKNALSVPVRVPTRLNA